MIIIFCVFLLLHHIYLIFKHFDCNYGAMHVPLDWLFGTYAGCKEEVFVFSIRNIEYNLFLYVVLLFIVSVQGVEDLARPEVWRRGKRDAGECLPPHHHHQHKHQHHCPPPNHHYHHHYHQHHHHCHHPHYINAGAYCQRQVWQGGVVA